MSDNRPLLADLLKDRCPANGRCYEMLLSSARNRGNGGGVGETSPDSGAKASHDREVGRRLFGHRRDRFNIKRYRRAWPGRDDNDSAAGQRSQHNKERQRPHDRVHPGAESRGSSPSFFNPEQLA
jgi:hypothetical protein